MFSPPTSHRTIFMYRHGEDDFLLEAEGEDRFMMKGRAVMAACIEREENAKISRVMTEQALVVLGKIRNWIADHRESINTASFTFRPGEGLLFVVVQNRVERDDELADALTRLDLDIAQDEQTNLMSLDVLSVPLIDEDARSAFIADQHFPMD